MKRLLALKKKHVVMLLVVVGGLSLSLMALLVCWGVLLLSPRTEVTEGIDVVIHTPSSQGTCAMRFVWVEDLGIWFGKTEVTLAQLAAPQLTKEFEGWPGYTSTWPAGLVSPDRAEEFCRSLNRQFRLPAGWCFRLPTLREWEHVASCGGTRRYPWGDSWPPVAMDDGNPPNLRGVDPLPSERRSWNDPFYFHLTAVRIEGYRDGWPGPAPVLESGKNPLGIYGLSGNVWEWCYTSELLRSVVRKGGCYGTGPGSTLLVTSDDPFPARPSPFAPGVTERYSFVTGFRVVIGKR